MIGRAGDARYNEAMPKIKTPRLMPQGGVIPKPEGYPDALDNDAAIADHIVSLSVDDIDSQMVEEAFFGSKAILRFIPMDDIQPGHSDTNIRVAAREKAYAKLPQDTCPPIVIENGQIQDGHHRYRVALKAGAPGMWCYDVVEDEQ